MAHTEGRLVVRATWHGFDCKLSISSLTLGALSRQQTAAAAPPNCALPHRESLLMALTDSRAAASACSRPAPLSSPPPPVLAMSAGSSSANASVMTMVVATGQRTLTRNQGWWGRWQTTWTQNVASRQHSQAAGAADAAPIATCMHGKRDTAQGLRMAGFFPAHAGGRCMAGCKHAGTFGCSLRSVGSTHAHQPLTLPSDMMLPVIDSRLASSMRWQVVPCSWPRSAQPCRTAWWQQCACGHFATCLSCRLCTLTPKHGRLMQGCQNSGSQQQSAYLDHKSNSCLQDVTAAQQPSERHQTGSTAGITCCCPKHLHGMLWRSKQSHSDTCVCCCDERVAKRCSPETDLLEVEALLVVMPLGLVVLPECSSPKGESYIHNIFTV